MEAWLDRHFDYISFLPIWQWGYYLLYSMRRIRRSCSVVLLCMFIVNMTAAVSSNDFSRLNPIQSRAATSRRACTRLWYDRRRRRSLRDHWHLKWWKRLLQMYSLLLCELCWWWRQWCCSLLLWLDCCGCLQEACCLWQWGKAKKVCLYGGEKYHQERYVCICVVRRQKS